MDDANVVSCDKKTMLESLKRAFIKCSALAERQYRISPSQRLEYMKALAYLSQVIVPLEKELSENSARVARTTDGNILALQMLEKDGIIQIIDLEKLRVLLGEPEEKTQQ